MKLKEEKLIMVRIFYKDGTDEIKEVYDVSDICLDNVIDIKTIREQKAA